MTQGCTELQSWEKQCRADTLLRLAGKLPTLRAPPLINDTFWHGDSHLLKQQPPQRRHVKLKSKT